MDSSANEVTTLSSYLTPTEKGQPHIEHGVTTDTREVQYLTGLRFYLFLTA